MSLGKRDYQVMESAKSDRCTAIASIDPAPTLDTGLTHANGHGTGDDQPFISTFGTAAMTRYKCRNRLEQFVSWVISTGIVLIVFSVSVTQLGLAANPDFQNYTAQHVRTPISLNLESLCPFEGIERAYVLTTNKISNTPRQPRSQRISTRKHNSSLRVAQVHSIASPAESSIPLTPKCADLKQTEPCWQELHGNSQCFVWSRYYIPEQTVTWSGGCSSGRASGNGTLVRTEGKLSEKEIGLLDQGKKQLQWTIHHSDDTVSKGRYIDGYKDGHWSTLYPDGREAGGSYEHGYKTGHWVQRTLDGTVARGPFLKGKRHGRWWIQIPSGAVVEGPFVHGARTGWWTEEDASGNVYEGPYSEGRKNGIWTLTATNGAVIEGRYVDDLQHGWWMERHPDGGVVEGKMENGKKVGRWITRYTDGTTLEGDHLDGKQHGVWTIRYPDGTISELTYVHGEHQE